MLSVICDYLKNWFDYNQPKYFGRFTISDGKLNIDEDIPANQYYRIVGSIYNDGVYKHDGSESLVAEEFEGAIWLMVVPKDIISLAAEVKAWNDKYAGVDSEAMSPFQSESFGGYSYSKSSGGNSASASSVPTWQGVFADRLRRYRKI